MALGTNEVSLLHLTSAYATFANRGVRAPTTSVLEITDNQGHPLYSYDAAHPHGVRALREDVAFLMSSILSDKLRAITNLALATRWNWIARRRPKLGRPIVFAITGRWAIPPISRWCLGR